MSRVFMYVCMCVSVVIVVVSLIHSLCIDRVRLLHCLRFVYISVEEGNEEMQSEQSVKRTAPPTYTPSLPPAVPPTTTYTAHACVCKSRHVEWKSVRDTFVCCCLSYYLCTVNRNPAGDRQRQKQR